MEQSTQQEVQKSRKRLASCFFHALHYLYFIFLHTLQNFLLFDLMYG